MIKVSASEAWSATAAFMRRHSALVIPVALAFLALPAILFQPDMEALAAADPDPRLLLPIIPISLVSVVGSLAINALALRPAISVGEALALALRRFLPALGAALLLTLVFVLVTIPVALAFAAVPPAAALLAILLVPFFIYLAARMLLINPIVVDEPVGPIQALRRSWALTRGNGWRLFAILLVAGLAAIIVILALTAVIGSILLLLGAALGGPDTGRFLVSAFSSIVGAIVSALFIVFIANLYRQLAGASSGV